MQKDKPDYYNDLDKIYFRIWELLDLGVQNGDASFHIPVFVCGNKDKFDGRIVVLRGINKSEKKIWFHSDMRSGKVKILKTNSKGSLLFYDKSEKIQLRIYGNIKINYQNDTTYRAWKKTSHMSRQCYLGDKAPGLDFSYPTSGLTENIDNFKYSIKESEIGCKNFCVIETFVESIEWLYLATKGHRRALFFIKNNSLEKKWLIP